MGINHDLPPHSIFSVLSVYSVVHGLFGYDFSDLGFK